MVLIPTERYRKRTTSITNGVAKYQATGVHIAGSGAVHNTEHFGITDWRRPKGDPEVYPLSVVEYTEEGGFLNKDGTGTDSLFENYMPAVYDWDNFPHHVTLPGNPSDTAAATMAAARTNPSRPYVDVPVFIAELADITSLIQSMGKTIIGKAARGNLAYQFGLKPLVDDMVKLVNFASAFHQRMAEIKRLASKGGLRRTVDIGTYSNSGWYQKILQSQGLFRRGWFFANTKVVVRVHCRWIPTPGFGKLSANNIEWLVKRVNHGLTLDAATLWEAIPFTWLIDYFSTVGAYFKANRNIIPCQLQGCYVMRHSTTDYGFYGLSDADWEFAPSHIHYETKTRKKVTVAPTAQLPFLTANQTGILTSLGIVLSKRF